MSENFVCSNKEKGCKGTCLRTFTYPEFQDALFRSYDEATLEELGPPTIQIKLKNEHNQYCSTTVTSLEVAKIKNVFNEIAADPAINQTLRETYQQLSPQMTDAQLGCLGPPQSLASTYNKLQRANYPRSST